MKIAISIFFVVTLLYLFIQHNHILSPLTRDGWSVECGNSIHTANNLIHMTLPKGQLRCEIARLDWVKLGEEFDLIFSVSTPYLNGKDSEWHSLMQIHGLPDKDLNEGWRCPVLDLEVHNGKFRAFNRWDSTPLSKLQEGTCSSPENSIRNRTLFKNYSLEENKEYVIHIQGVFTHEENGWLKFSINEELLANIKGPTAYNDKTSPYLKLGIYKPTSWAFSEPLVYEFTSIEYKKIKNKNF